MRRRDLLELAGGALAGSTFAGCAAPASGDPDAPYAVPDRGRPVVSIEHTGAPPAPCPRSDPSPGIGPWEETVCWRGEPPADAPGYMAPASRVGHLPETTLAFTAQNASDVPLSENRYSWFILKYVDGAWYDVSRRPIPAIGGELAAGASHTWRLTVDNTRPLGLRPENPTYPNVRGGEMYPRVPGLGPGHYVFGWAPDVRDRTIALLAPFELRGEFAMRPTAGVEVLDDADGRLVVRDATLEASMREADLFDEEFVTGRFRCERLPDTAVDGDPPVWVPEQALRYRHLRNILAYAAGSGYDTVVLEVPKFARMNGFGPFDRAYIRFRGDVYRLSKGGAVRDWLDELWLSVTNHDEDAHEVTVTLSVDDAEALTRTVTLDSGQSARFHEEDRPKIGFEPTFHLELDVAGGPTLTANVRSDDDVPVTFDVGFSHTTQGWGMSVETGTSPPR